MDAQILASLIDSVGTERVTAYAARLKKLTDPFARFQWSKHAAILEVPDAVKEVVAAYKEGIGTEPNQVQAFEWMKKGAEVLQITSLYFELALAYRDGVGTPKNIERFWEFMGKAAKLKDTEAMFELAEAHTKIELGYFSAERSAEWTIKGAAEGDPNASIKLARRYQIGDGVKKDPREFFKYANKAVQSAKSKWEIAKESKDGEDIGGWAYEDYPDALIALAEAYKDIGNSQEAEKTILLAADRARDAIEIARVRGDTVNAGKSKSLPEILLGRLRQFKNKNGKINKRRNKNYLKWLLAIDDGVKQVYFSEDGPNSIPPGLIQATFELAVVYEQGIGIPADKSKGFEYMSRAAKAGHAEAAYRCAMKCYEANKHLEFTEYLAMGAAANDFKSRHAQALVDCGLVKHNFLIALSLLETLHNTVHHIRSSRHAISPEEAAQGIAHYTDGGGLTSMLGTSSINAKNVIRLYNIAYVNDPKEGKRLKNFKKEGFENPLNDFFNMDGTPHEAISWQGQEFVVFIACFSLRMDDLNLWRFYGKDGTGYSVVSPLTAFDKESDHGILRGGAWMGKTKAAPPITLYKVLYDDALAQKALNELAVPLNKIRTLMNELTADATDNIRKIAAAIVSELLYLYKDSDYDQEKEVRAVEARTLADPELKQHERSLNHFSKLFIETRPILFQPGSSIIIGPKVETASAILLDIKHRLARAGFVDCEVQQSSISYR